jgi:hypothetical protein
VTLDPSEVIDRLRGNPEGESEDDMRGSPTEAQLALVAGLLTKAVRR